MLTLQICTAAAAVSCYVPMIPILVIGVNVETMTLQGTRSVGVAAFGWRRSRTMSYANVPVQVGSLRSGHWCSQCQLPSIVSVDIYALLDDGPSLFGKYWECPDCGTASLHAIGDEDIPVCALDCLSESHPVEGEQ